MNTSYFHYVWRGCTFKTFCTLFATVLITFVINACSTKSTITTIQGKQIKPPYTTTIYGKVPSGIFPIYQHHPESYYVEFESNGKKLEARVDKSFFKGHQVGDAIKIDYCCGELNEHSEIIRVTAVHE